MSRSISYFIAILAIAFAFNSCGPSIPVPPMEVNYSVSSPDTGAQGMVHTYFGEYMNYKVYDSTTFQMKREGLLGAVTQWYDKDAIYIRETMGDYCTCVQLEGTLFEMWKKDEWISNYEYSAEKGTHLGYATMSGVAVGEMGDTTWIEIAPDIINPWFENPSLPGLPLKYEYLFRGKKVTYEVDKIDALKESYDPSSFADGCVRIPPPAFMGMAPQDSMTWDTNDIWVFGGLFDDADNYVRGDVMVEVSSESGVEQAKMRVDQGTYDLQLLPGELYTLDFTAEGQVHKRIELDCRDMPEDQGSFLLNMDVHLFEAVDPEVDDYLSRTPVGVAYFDVDSMNLIFDFEYTKQVAMELSRLQLEGEE